MNGISGECLFDSLSPGDMSLPMAVCTAYNAGLKESDGADQFAYYDCANNNPGTMCGQSWQRSGPMYAVTKALAEAWNAAVQRSHLPFEEKQLYLLTETEARRTCAIISNIVRADPVKATKELISFHPHLDSAARRNVTSIQRFAPPHASYVDASELENHINECVRQKERERDEAMKMTRAVSAPDDGKKRPDGLLTVSDGKHYAWVPLDMIRRPDNHRDTPRDRTNSWYDGKFSGSRAGSYDSWRGRNKGRNASQYKR